MNQIAYASVMSTVAVILNFVLIFVVMPMRSMRTKLEDEQEKKIAAVKADLSKEIAVAFGNVDRVSTALTLLKDELHKVITKLEVQMDDVRQRLLSGHEHMHRLDQQDHKIEKDVIEKLARVQELLATQPTKNDFNNLRTEMIEMVGRQGHA